MNAPSCWWISAALLPLLIHQAHESGDLSPLAAQALIVSDNFGRTASVAMMASVLCAEDIPFFTPAEAERANAGSYLGNAHSDMLFEICSIWPRGESPATFKEPVRSEVPVLLLSGEADPVTPPQYGEQVARTLPNSLHLVAPGQGRNVIPRGCLPRIAAAFVKQATVVGLDSACVARLDPPPFFVDFTGP